jgi:hypothetical protein
MSNTIKYSTGSESQSLKKGNFYIGTGDVGKGPTTSTGFWSGITPPIGGYSIYVHKETNGPSIRVANNDSELIIITNQIANTNYTTKNQCLQYFATQDDKMVMSSNIPPIITNGLSLYLDPSNISSYPQGNTWYDLANGITFNSVGSTLSTSLLNNGLGFSFNGSGYWQSSSNNELVNLGGDCTIILWVYGIQGPTRKTIFEKAGTNAQSYQQEIAMTWEVPSSISWYSRRTPLYDFGSTNSTSTGVWNMMSIKMSTGLTPSPRTGFYSENGSSWVSSYTSRSDTPLTPSGAIRIGSGYAGTCNTGGIGTVMCYNRMLDDVEILQVYNSTKTLYGL